MSDQLVRLHLPFRGMEDFDRWAELEERLGDAAERAQTGELDGNEVGEGEYTIWLYGDSAARLAETVRTALVHEQLPPQCYLFVRHGDVSDADAKEETISIS